MDNYLLFQKSRLLKVEAVFKMRPRVAIKTFIYIYIYLTKKTKVIEG